MPIFPLSGAILESNAQMHHHGKIPADWFIRAPNNIRITTILKPLFTAISNMSSLSWTLLARKESKRSCKTLHILLLGTFSLEIILLNHLERSGNTAVFYLRKTITHSMILGQGQNCRSVDGGSEAKGPRWNFQNSQQSSLVSSLLAIWAPSLPASLSDRGDSRRWRSH